MSADHVGQEEHSVRQQLYFMAMINAIFNDDADRGRLRPQVLLLALSMNAA